MLESYDRFYKRYYYNHICSEYCVTNLTRKIGISTNPRFFIIQILARTYCRRLGDLGTLFHCCLISWQYIQPSGCSWSSNALLISLSAVSARTRPTDRLTDERSMFIRRATSASEILNSRTAKQLIRARAWENRRVRSTLFTKYLFCNKWSQLRFY